MADDRRPRAVYREGDEPDPRFTFANERTFLAWIRTSLALLAAGVALGMLGSGVPETPRLIGAVTLVGLAISLGGTSYARWAACERALRQGRPLPPPRLGPVLACAVAGIGLVAALLFVLRT